MISIFGQVFFLGSNSSLYYAFSKSDILGQGICIFLFLFSIAIWVVMLEKIIILRKAEQYCDYFFRLFKEKRNPLCLREKALMDPSPAAQIYLQACERVELFHLNLQDPERRALSDSEITIIRNTMEQAVENQLLQLEKRSLFLATAVSVSPFLGLFGTVWGITLAFTELAIKGKADIQTLAPGVSGALLTTVIALIVAIPSLVGYNMIGASVRKLTVKLDAFVEEMTSRLKIEQMDKNKPEVTGHLQGQNPGMHVQTPPSGQRFTSPSGKNIY